ncbi:MAG: SpoIIE family protein phosphatase, partial [Bacteroidota bacterium]
SAFSDNVSVAFENARLVKDSIEKERYKRELLLAREIEEKLLPRILPKINNYSLSAFSSPAEEVGGDYYDLVHLKDGKPCLLIGDVSGKGISAAFHMAQLKGVVLAVAPESSGASDILKRINATLYGAMEKQMYITLSAVVVNDENGNITIARAGHMPFLFKHNGDITSILPKGIGIGLAEKSFFNANIEETDCIMQKGDICLLFTDGVNELQNHKNEEFGINSLKQVLRYEIHKNIENLLSDIRIQLKNYSGNVPPHDDMTIVALEFSDKTNTI